eukprot:CAMPEP_0185308242 /NCGR_PEP_ID=MMETSP1363-20130426/19169_1 /TAXON_ID=38817 /ORGANISM="Gephyrocapsa oceanica, Strain RCC1303" /LENGTH=88 /DNA_ID=CAMNT_0027905639 /DNA_START=163 /DNA_END=426 /DNA_ORIENTATION=+
MAATWPDPEQPYPPLLLSVQRYVLVGLSLVQRTVAEPPSHRAGREGRAAAAAPPPTTMTAATRRRSRPSRPAQHVAIRAPLGARWGIG